MKNVLVVVFMAFFSSFIYAQEICDNGIDDDGDGFIDLNDDECDCTGFGGDPITGLIPNPSFEDMDCCPTWHSQLNCATTWTQASSATSDYYNTCDFVAIVGEGVTGADLGGLPDGEGWVGYWSNPGYAEYIGACLDGPLLAGVEYTLHFYTAWGFGPADHEFSIYATPDCAELPWVGLDCPTGIDSWELLSSTTITYATDGTWQEEIITFTPAIDYAAIAFGGPCGGEPGNRYTYIDGLTLIDSESFSSISETGNWCDGDLALHASTDTIDGTWQWYKDGVALDGETGIDIDVMLYGLGDYSAVYFLDGNCLRSNHTVVDSEGISADFEFTNACVGQEVDFSNTSVYGGGVIPTWGWDFAGEGSSTDENPSYEFGTAGTYLVELIAYNDAGCNDTIEIEVIVDPTPIADFEFVIGGLSSEDGATGGCLVNPVQFNDFSTIAAPGTITEWDWDFGDAETSTEENPEHIYTSAGTFTIILTVTSENGCTATTTLEIIMTESLILDIVFNDPTCFGLSDGSVTVNVTGGAGDLVFDITDESGTTLNIDNSNTANTLPTGWYYFDVSDGTSCSGVDSVFLNQPGELSIDLDLTNPLCYGDETGIAVVDSVYNATGDYSLINYNWNPNPAGNNGLEADSTWGMGAGDYIITLNDENGCTNVFNFTITQPDSLYFVEFGSESAFCRLHEYQSGNGIVFGAAIGGVPDYNYLWENLETGEISEYSTWGGINPGMYQLTATDQNGCTLIQNILLDSVSPIAAFTVNSAQLNGDCQGTAPVDVSFTNQSSNFYNPNDPGADSTFFMNLDTPYANWQITHDYLETFDTTYLSRGQTYQVNVCLVALNQNGCTDTVCKLLTIYEPKKLEEINIFSPNGDGINDIFTFEFKSASIAEFNCLILNRWGQTIYEITDINDGWNGENKNGNLCSNGVYFYKYNAVTDDSTVLSGQGTIQLIGIIE